MSADVEAEAARLIAAQRQYYDLRAPDFADPSRPSDRRRRGEMNAGDVSALIRQLGELGDVLEIACGSGAFTKELMGRATSLTALDGSPAMLEINRQVVGDDAVEYVCADVFEWAPTRRFDVVFFGFWLSHVPPTRFDEFWATVRACLRPDGRAVFVDEDVRARENETALSDEVVPTATRTLSDGRTFDIVKVFWDPHDLQQRLLSAGWQANVQPFGPTFLFGEAR